MRAPAIIIALLTPFLASTSTANADEVTSDAFASMASSAQAVDSSDTMQALLWPQSATCEGINDELVRLQCEGIKKASQARTATRSYLLEGSGAAIQSAIAADKKSVDISLFACIQCDFVGSLVLGLGDYQRNGAQIEAPSLAKTNKVFATSKKAEAWNKRIGQRLQAQFIVKLPANIERFSDGDLVGHKVEVVGYRLYNPCQGDVLLAKPASASGPVDKEACAAEPVKKIIVKKAPVVDRLSAKQIKLAMKPAQQQAKACHKIYNIEGRAQYKIVIGGNGSMVEMIQSGDFLGTPTGMCLDQAMAKVVFPKSKKAKTKISYPILLR